MLRRDLIDLKRHRRRVAKSFAEEFGMHVREAVPEYILWMCEAHFSSAREDGLTGEQVYRALTEEYDLGLHDPGGSLGRRFERQ